MAPADPLPNHDPFDLQRFVIAQDDVIDDVRTELARGRKTGHWMWFVFPQLRGLGQSSMAYRYGIGSRAEAEAYLSHPVLGSRLTECALLVNQVEDRTAEQIFGVVDSVKLRSSMTLFAQVAGDSSVFAQALRKYYGGLADPMTLERL